MDLSNKASNLRKKLGADGESPIDIFKLVQKIENLTLVFYGLGKNISGVCYKPQLFTPNLKTIQNPCLSLDPGWFLFHPMGVFY
ncbi:zinc metallopeptidase [Streptococcus pneumoniae]|nr:zinc metallopeptidase [Streptococcus pneumoniae]